MNQRKYRVRRSPCLRGWLVLRPGSEWSWVSLHTSHSEAVKAADRYANRRPV